MQLRPLTACVLAVLLCSCASTSVESTWKSPEYRGGGVTKAAVLAVDNRPLLRQGFENRIVAQLKKAGVAAVSTFGLLSLDEIQRDRSAAAERLRSSGCDVVVILRLADKASSYREVRPGGERYAEYVTGFEPGTWYDYYSFAYMDISPTYGSLKQTVYLETSIFELKTAKRRWAGLTETVATETMDRVEEMDRIVAKVVGAMYRDGVIP